MAPASTHHVFVSVPKRDGFKGIFAIGRFFEDGKSGPHVVTDDELATLKANSRLAVEVASAEEIEAGAAIVPQTSALTPDEAELLASYRSAKAQKVEVTLVRVAELDQAHSRAAELEAEVRKANDRAGELDAQSKATGAELTAARARIADLEQQLKAAESKDQKRK